MYMFHYVHEAGTALEDGKIHIIKNLWGHKDISVQKMRIPSFI